MGAQERSSSTVCNIVKCVIPYTNNEQELVTLLASYMNHRGLSVIGWILVTDRESAYQKIAQCYFETFTSAIVKVIVANCASLSTAAIDASSPKAIAEEASSAIQHLVGLCIYNGIKHDPNIGDYISNGFFPFTYPISPAEVMAKVMSIDQLNHDLPCDPVEFRILTEIQAGLAGGDNVKMDLTLLESLAQSSFGIPGKKFRSRRATANAFPSSSLTTSPTTPVPTTPFSASASESTEYSAEIVIDDNSQQFMQPASDSIGRSKVQLMSDSDVEIVFGSGSSFIQETINNSPLLYSEFDQINLDAVALSSRNSGAETLLEKYLDVIQEKYEMLAEQSKCNSALMESYVNQCKEVEFLLGLWNCLNQQS